jgi:hypothetical protein
MSSAGEIIANTLLFLSLMTFAVMCFWTMHNLDRDHKKPKHKTKKA